jgi:hypothetical protein
MAPITYSVNLNQDKIAYSYCLLPIAYCQLPIANCLLPVAY